jgi:hypothetical protein
MQKKAEEEYRKQQGIKTQPVKPTVISVSKGVYKRKPRYTFSKRKLNVLSRKAHRREKYFCFKW